MENPADLGFDYKPDLPIPISQVGGRYLLFDIKIATFLRREYRICGTQTGTLPVAPSQNLFLGLPIEIMPEEAQLLVEKGVAVVVDDARAHDQAVLRFSDRSRRADYLASLEKQARRFEQVSMQEKEQSRQRALEKRAKETAKASSTAPSTPRQAKAASSLLDFDEERQQQQQQQQREEEEDAASTAPREESSVRDEPVPSLTEPEQPANSASHYHITPATSQPLLPESADTPKSAVQDLPASYPMYKHLHEKGYFMTPGLRFGCQYNVYPGDQLRFHSHFLASAFEWDKPIDLMDVVGGGRLGTGVKKGFLLGGANPTGQVRTFSVEWAAM